jgi:hypothetical protein
MERAFKPLKGSLDNAVAILSGNWAIGSSGAVGTKVGGTGLLLARTGTGTYTVQLKGHKNTSCGVPALLFVGCGVVTSDADPTNDTDAISARVLSMVASTGLITIQTFDEAGVVRDPASGAKLMVTVHAQLSSATR